MNLGGFFIVFSMVLQIAFTFDGRLFKPIHDAKVGLLDILTKPKIHKIPVIGIQVNKHIAPGSFGFGFGIGGQFVPTSGSEVNLPPKERPDITSEDEYKGHVGPRPNWGEEEEDKVEKPKPGPYDYDKEDSKPESFEKDKAGKKPDWEEIGEEDEEDQDPKSEYLMNGELVADGLIHPRLNRDRVKRFIDSKVYHVALKFLSNAKPGNKVKIYNNPNSLEN